MRDLTQLYNRALSATEVLQNYNAICGRFGKTPTITDGDALSFVNAANISNETQQSAINTLVTDLKGAGLWSKMKAIYPFVGGTAASHKWNLKDPRDVDAAFRLTFSGGWTHSSTGAKGNGTTAYADTFIIPTTHLTQNNTHLSYYSRTADDAQYVELGYYNNGTAIIQITTRYTGFGGIAGSYSTANQVTAAVSSGTYYGINSKTSSTSLKMYRNGVQLGTTNTTSDVQFTNLIGKIYLNARNDNGTTAFYSARECAFATIGDGLTDTDAANLYTIVQKYQTTLGRQV